MSTRKELIAWVLRGTWRVVVTVVGFILLAGGLVMMVTPGPGILLLIAGFAVLGTQYAWARRALKVTQKQAVRMRNTVRARRARKKLD